MSPLVWKCLFRAKNHDFSPHIFHSSWDKIPNMGQTRHLSASILDPNGDMWVLGGSSNSSAADSTEIYQYKPQSRGFGRWRKGFPLPPDLRDTGVESHCSVSINSTHKFLGGGYARNYDFRDTVKNDQRNGMLYRH